VIFKLCTTGSKGVQRDCDEFNISQPSIHRALGQRLWRKSGSGTFENHRLKDKYAPGHTTVLSGLNPLKRWRNTTVVSNIL